MAAEAHRVAVEAKAVEEEKKKERLHKAQLKRRAEKESFAVKLAKEIKGQESIVIEALEKAGYGLLSQAVLDLLTAMHRDAGIVIRANGGIPPGEMQRLSAIRLFTRTFSSRHKRLEQDLRAVTQINQKVERWRMRIIEINENSPKLASDPGKG